MTLILRNIFHKKLLCEVDSLITKITHDLPIVNFGCSFQAKNLIVCCDDTTHILKLLCITACKAPFYHLVRLRFFKLHTSSPLNLEIKYLIGVELLQEINPSIHLKLNEFLLPKILKIYSLFLIIINISLNQYYDTPSLSISL